MRSSKVYGISKKVEEPKVILAEEAKVVIAEEAKEEIFPVEEKVSTKRKNKKTLLEIMEEEE